MKKLILSIGICILLICSALTINVAAEPTIVRLPSELVKMEAENDPASWFMMKLTDVPVGFDITDGQYHGWCVEVGTIMERGVNNNVRLYSSYDPAMPVAFQSPNWDKVNYIINNKGTYGRQTIQEVIWYFICDDPLPTNNTDARDLAAAANASGDGFVPTFGQSIAILANVEISPNPVQRTFFEFQLRPALQLGDLVWNDLNTNGIQDKGEPGLQAVTVRLLNESGGTIATKTTDSYGYYNFSGQPEGNYSIQFVLKSQNYRFSPVDQGSNDSLDSDADRTTGKTPAFTAFISGTNNMSWDAGMYVVEEPGGPGSPGTPTPPPEAPNQAPTADGTAGEPYVKPFGQNITFNGSRSYDSDGTIVTYHWTFGDGTAVNGSIVNHNYTNPGKYPVTLTVTDNDGATDTYNTNASSRLPNRPPLPPTLTGPTDGNRNISYVFNVATTDPDEDNVRYVLQWGDGSQNTSIFFSNGHKMQTTHQWSAWGFYTIQAHAQDTSNVTSDVSEIMIAIDVQYVGNQGYLINTDSVGPFDAFYSNQTQSQTGAQRQQTGVYLIDTNGDGKYDYQYDPSSATSRAYPEALAPEYTMLLVGVGVVILVLLIVGFLVNRRWKKP